jgi:hypothetical protein
VKLHAAWGAAIVRGYAGVDYWVRRESLGGVLSGAKPRR